MKTVSCAVVFTIAVLFGARALAQERLGPIPPEQMTETQKQVVELLDGEFARAGYEIEDVIIDAAARPPRITVVADSDDGLDLDAAAALSRSASALLDRVDDTAAPYVLEVTSPGVDRPLTTGNRDDRIAALQAWQPVGDGPAEQERLRLIDQFWDWNFRARAQGGEFDFGDETDFRRGIDLFVETARKRYCRTRPCTLVIARETFGLRSILYRLRAKIDIAAIEAARSG